MSTITTIYNLIDNKFTFCEKDIIARHAIIDISNRKKNINLKQIFGELFHKDINPELVFNNSISVLEGKQKVVILDELVYTLLSDINCENYFLIGPSEEIIATIKIFYFLKLFPFNNKKYKFIFWALNTLYLLIYFDFSNPENIKYYTKLYHTPLDIKNNEIVIEQHIIDKIIFLIKSYLKEEKPPEKVLINIVNEIEDYFIVNKDIIWGIVKQIYKF